MKTNENRVPRPTTRSSPSLLCGTQESKGTWASEGHGGREV